MTNDVNKCIDSFQAMLKSAREAGDQIHEGVALSFLSMNYLFGHRFEDAVDYSERAHRLAMSTNNQAALAMSMFTR